MELPVKEHIIKSNNEDEDMLEVPVNAIKGSKKRRMAILKEQKVQDAVSDPNVIGFDVS